MERVEGLNCVKVSTAPHKRGDTRHLEGAPTRVLDRVRMLVHETAVQFSTNLEQRLRWRVLLPLDDGSFVDYESLDAAVAGVHFDPHFGLYTASQVRDRVDLRHWFLTAVHHDGYDLFLSYRGRVSARAVGGRGALKIQSLDSRVARAIFDNRRNNTDKADFLDTVRFSQHGYHHDMDALTGCLSALVSSKVAVPIVSVDAVRSLAESNPDHVDFVLLEWWAMLELHASRHHASAGAPSVLVEVCPVYVPSESDVYDSTRDAAFAEAKTLPRDVHGRTYDALKLIWENLGRGSPSKLSPFEVVGGILKLEGYSWSSRSSGAGSTCPRFFGADAAKWLTDTPLACANKASFAREVEQLSRPHATTSLEVEHGGEVQSGVRPKSQGGTAVHDERVAAGGASQREAVQIADVQSGGRATRKLRKLPKPPQANTRAVLTTPEPRTAAVGESHRSPVEVAVFFSTKETASYGIWQSLNKEIDDLDDHCKSGKVNYAIDHRVDHHFATVDALFTKLTVLSGRRSAGGVADLVLQFIGHGHDGHLVFDSELNVPEMAVLIASCRPTCVIFNACETFGIAQAVHRECVKQGLSTVVGFWYTPVVNRACERLSKTLFPFISGWTGAAERDASSVAAFLRGIVLARDRIIEDSDMKSMFPCRCDMPKLGALPDELPLPDLCACDICAAAGVSPAVPAESWVDVPVRDVVCTTVEPSLGADALGGDSPAGAARHDDFPVIVDEEGMMLLSTDMANAMRGRPVFTIFDQAQTEVVAGRDKGAFKVTDWDNFLESFNLGFVKLWHGRYFECAAGPSREFWFQMDPTRRFHQMGNVGKLVVLHIHYAHGSADFARVTHVNARWSIPPNMQKLSHFRPLMRRSIQEGGLCITGTCNTLCLLSPSESY